MIKSLSILAVLLAGVVASTHDDLTNGGAAIDHAKPCKLGEKRRIATGSYYEECLPRFETNGCFANWEEGKKQFVKNGALIDRFYSDRNIGFLYRCEKTDNYIYFAPESCFIVRKNGKKEKIELNAKAVGNNGETVHCKKNSNGEFSFEYGDSQN